jgi:hypothetical protein
MNKQTMDHVYMINLGYVSDHRCKRFQKEYFLTGSTQIWTGVAGFKVQSANRYTIEPHECTALLYLKFLYFFGDDCSV